MIKFYGVSRGLVRGLFLGNPVPYPVVKYGVISVTGFYGVSSYLYAHARARAHARTCRVIELETPGNPVNLPNLLFDKKMTHGVLDFANPVVPRKARGFDRDRASSALLDPDTADRRTMVLTTAPSTIASGPTSATTITFPAAIAIPEGCRALTMQLEQEDSHADATLPGPRERPAQPVLRDRRPERIHDRSVDRHVEGVAVSAIEATNRRPIGGPTKEQS